MANPWERYPTLAHLSGTQLERMQRRRRQRLTRYWLFRFQHAEEHGEPYPEPEPKMPGFTSFWLEQVPAYQINPRGLREPVDPTKKGLPVEHFGGYAQFGTLWDVDEDLEVYLRHSSVWQEWNATLYRVVPVLGER